MAKRRDNMLEAFRESSRIDNPPEAPTPRAGESLPIEPDGRADAARREPELPPAPAAAAAPTEEPDLVGVAGVPAGRAAVPGTSGQSAPASSDGTKSRVPRAQITLPLGREWFFGLATLLLTSAFLLGRCSAGTIEAAGPSGDEPHWRGASSQAAARGLSRGSRDPATQAGLGPLEPLPGDRSGARERRDAPGVIEQLTAADEAFLDPANAYTVVAITYDDTDTGRDLAVATYRHLEEADFDVVYPRRKAGKLLIFVGAAPGYRDLESVESRLQRTPGPAGRLAFTGAYRVNIADYR